MPRFFFDNGTNDDDGIDLATEEQASAVSYKLVHELARDAAFEDDRLERQVTVRDETGPVLETRLSIKQKWLRR